MYENQNQSGGAEKLYNEAPVSKKCNDMCNHLVKIGIGQTDGHTDRWAEKLKRCMLTRDRTVHLHYRPFTSQLSTTYKSIRGKN